MSEVTEESSSSSTTSDSSSSSSLASSSEAESKSSSQRLRDLVELSRLVSPASTKGDESETETGSTASPKTTGAAGGDVLQQILNELSISFDTTTSRGDDETDTEGEDEEEDKDVAERTDVEKGKSKDTVEEEMEHTEEVTEHNNTDLEDEESEDEETVHQEDETVQQEEEEEEEEEEDEEEEEIEEEETEEEEESEQYTQTEVEESESEATEIGRSKSVKSITEETTSGEPTEETESDPPDDSTVMTESDEHRVIVPREKEPAVPKKEDERKCNDTESNTDAPETEDKAETLGPVADAVEQSKDSCEEVVQHPIEAKTRTKSFLPSFNLFRCSAPRPLDNIEDDPATTPEVKEAPSDEEILEKKNSGQEQMLPLSTTSIEFIEVEGGSDLQEGVKEEQVATSNEGSTTSEAKVLPDLARDPSVLVNARDKGFNPSSDLPLQEKKSDMPSPGSHPCISAPKSEANVLPDLARDPSVLVNVRDKGFNPSSDSPLQEKKSDIPSPGSHPRIGAPKALPSIATDPSALVNKRDKDLNSRIKSLLPKNLPSKNKVITTPSSIAQQDTESAFSFPLNVLSGETLGAKKGLIKAIHSQGIEVDRRENLEGRDGKEEEMCPSDEEIEDKTNFELSHLYEKKKGKNNKCVADEEIEDKTNSQSRRLKEKKKGMRFKRVARKLRTPSNQSRKQVESNNATMLPASNNNSSEENTLQVNEQGSTAAGDDLQKGGEHPHPSSNAENDEHVEADDEFIEMTFVPVPSTAESTEKVTHTLAKGVVRFKKKLNKSWPLKKSKKEGSIHAMDQPDVSTTIPDSNKRTKNPRGKRRKPKFFKSLANYVRNRPHGLPSIREIPDQEEGEEGEEEDIHERPGDQAVEVSLSRVSQKASEGASHTQKSVSEKDDTDASHTPRWRASMSQGSWGGAMSEGSPKSAAEGADQKDKFWWVPSPTGDKEAHLQICNEEVAKSRSERSGQMEGKSSERMLSEDDSARDCSTKKSHSSFVESELSMKTGESIMKSFEMEENLVGTETDLECEAGTEITLARSNDYVTEGEIDGQLVLSVDISSLNKVNKESENRSGHKIANILYDLKKKTLSFDNTSILSDLKKKTLDSLENASPKHLGRKKSAACSALPETEVEEEQDGFCISLAVKQDLPASPTLPSNSVVSHDVSCADKNSTKTSTNLASPGVVAVTTESNYHTEALDKQPQDALPVAAIYSHPASSKAATSPSFSKTEKRKPRTFLDTRSSWRSSRSTSREPQETRRLDSVDKQPSWIGKMARSQLSCRSEIETGQDHHASSFSPHQSVCKTLEVVEAREDGNVAAPPDAEARDEVISNAFVTQEAGSSLKQRKSRQVDSSVVEIQESRNKWVRHTISQCTDDSQHKDGNAAPSDSDARDKVSAQITQENSSVKQSDSRTTQYTDNFEHNSRELNSPKSLESRSSVVRQVLPTRNTRRSFLKGFWKRSHHSREDHEDEEDQRESSPPVPTVYTETRKETGSSRPAPKRNPSGGEQQLPEYHEDPPEYYVLQRWRSVEKKINASLKKAEVLASHYGEDISPLLDQSEPASVEHKNKALASHRRKAPLIHHSESGVSSVTKKINVSLKKAEVLAYRYGEDTNPLLQSASSKAHAVSAANSSADQDWGIVGKKIDDSLSKVEELASKLGLDPHPRAISSE